MHSAVFQVLATFGCNCINCVNQSESRIQILQSDWMAWFSLLQPDEQNKEERLYHRREQERACRNSGTKGTKAEAAAKERQSKMCSSKCQATVGPTTYLKVTNLWG